MGSFGGHAIPGSFFLLFGLWHAVDIYWRYFRSVLHSSAEPYQSRYSETK